MFCSLYVCLDMCESVFQPTIMQKHLDKDKDHSNFNIFLGESQTKIAVLFCQGRSLTGFALAPSYGLGLRQPSRFLSQFKPHLILKSISNTDFKIYSAKDGKILIYNITGSLITNQNIKSNESIEISLQNQNSGIYFVRVNLNHKNLILSIY